MSYEAIAQARKHGSIGAFEQKWLTVPTDSIADAIREFAALGYETAGMRVLTQEQAAQLFDEKT